MQSNPFTVEEENLICCASAKDRRAAIDGLHEALDYELDIEIKAMIHRVTRKLTGMSDIDFIALDLTAAEEE